MEQKHTKKGISLRTYTIIRLSATVALAIIVSQSIIFGSFVVPVVSVALFSVVLLFIRGRVREVIADERDYEVGGVAARWAISVFSWIAVVVMLALYAWRSVSFLFEPVALTLAFSVCVLMILYSLIFRFYGRGRKEKFRD